MGKGAFVSIQNQSTSVVTVSYDNFVCMYQDGHDGSDFRPISGPLSPGDSLPRNSNRQYIEAKASFPGCSFDTSEFTMNIAGPERPLSIAFWEKNDTYHVNKEHVVQGKLIASTTVESGKQYKITVLLRNIS